MKKSAVVAIVCLGLASLAGAAGTFDAGGAYSENFDSMGAAGTAPPADWLAGIYSPLRNRVDPPPDTSTVVSKPLYPDDGSSGVKGRAYNYGATGSAERAVGFIGTTSGWSDGALQVELLNNLNEPITGFALTYTGEQWRNNQGAAPVPEKFRVYASKSSNTGYTHLGTAFDFTAPINEPRGSGENDGFKLDGNAAANRATITGNVDLVALGVGAVQPGENLYLTWHDWNDDRTRDHGIAVDDVSVVIPEPATMSLLGLGALALLRRRRRS